MEHHVQHLLPVGGCSPKRSLAITLLRGVVLNTVLVLALPAILGVNGIWLVVTVSEFITAAVAFFFIRRETH